MSSKKTSRQRLIDSAKDFMGFGDGKAIEQSYTCDRKYLLDLLADFAERQARDILIGREREVDQEEWNGRCKCGHLHSMHAPIQSHNYSAGPCRKCECNFFIHGG